MATGAVTGGASAAGAMPASGALLLGSTTDLLQQLHQAQSLLKAADGAMQPTALQLLDVVRLIGIRLTVLGRRT